MHDIALEWYVCTWADGPEPQRRWGWYINLAYYLSRNEPVVPLPVADLLIAQGPDHYLNPARVDQASPDRLVLVAPLPIGYTQGYAQGEVLMLIDGHHTLAKAARLERPTVRGRVLTQEQAQACALAPDEIVRLENVTDPWEVLQRFHRRDGWPIVGLR